jgi:hypothetical protein
VFPNCFVSNFGNDDGIIGERAFTEVEGLHYVIGKHDIYVHDGHTRKTISDDRATEYFFESLGSETVAYVEHFIEKQEVLFVFARQDQKYASEGLIYSYLYDAWTSLRIDDAQGGDTGAFSHITRGPFSASGGPVTYDDLAATSYDDLAATSYDDLFPRSTKLDLYGLAPDLGGVYVFNQSPDTADFSPSLFLERIDYDLDEFFEVTASIKYWDRTIPLISGSGQVKFRFGGRNVLSEGIKWGVEKVYNVGTDWKIDHRTTYRYPAIQMIQDDNGSISMTGADLSVKAAHGR